MIYATRAVSVLFFYDWHEARTYCLKVAEAENEGGYGYQILCGDRVVICQPYIPSLLGRKGFILGEDARKVGNLILERVKQGNGFTISAIDLKGHGITDDQWTGAFRIRSKPCSRQFKTKVLQVFN